MEGLVWNLVHQKLKSITSVLQTKGHHQELKHPKGGDDGGLMYVLLLNLHLIIPLLQNQIRKNNRTTVP